MYLLCVWYSTKMRDPHVACDGPGWHLGDFQRPLGNRASQSHKQSGPKSSSLKGWKNFGFGDTILTCHITSLSMDSIDPNHLRSDINYSPFTSLCFNPEEIVSWFFLWLLITFDSFDVYSSLRVLLLGFCWDFMLTQAQDPGSSESHSLSVRDPERCLLPIMPTFLNRSLERLIFSSRDWKKGLASVAKGPEVYDVYASLSKPFGTNKKAVFPRFLPKAVVQTAQVLSFHAAKPVKSSWNLVLRWKPS